MSYYDRHATNFILASSLFLIERILMMLIVGKGFVGGDKQKITKYICIYIYI